MLMPPQFLPIPDNVRAYLHARGIDDDGIALFKLSYAEKKGKGWIAIPVRGADGVVAFWKLRAAPGNDAPNKYCYEPSGVGAELYGRGLLALPSVSRVVVCEGEFDAMLLIKNDIAAVTSTSGVGTFKEEWCDLFPPHCHVVLCFDNDSPGEKGREKVKDLFRARRSDCVLTDVRFVQTERLGFDVTDFFQRHGDRAVEEFWKLETTDAEKEKSLPFTALHSESGVPGHADHGISANAEEGEEGNGDEDGRKAAQKEEQENGPSAKRRIAKLQAPSEVIDLAAWKEKIREQFPKLVSTAEVCASVVAQLLIQDVANPFALILTDRPASGKTITINFFRKLPELMYFTSDFTPASFVSGIAGRTPKQLQEIDLLPKIRWKTLLVKDLAPLLADNDDVLRKRLGMLTDILDGEGYRTESGVHGSRGYSGSYLFMFLAASTPFSPRVWRLMTGMGHRLFFLGLDSKRKSLSELRSQITGMHYQKKIVICRDATHEFLKGLWAGFAEGVAWEAEKDAEAAIGRICECADFLALYRGDIYVHEERWTDGKVLTHTEPRIEDSSRINQCLYNLARGHAVISGRSHIVLEDLEVVYRVVMDTAPAPRPKIMRALLAARGKMTVQEVAETLGMSIKTAKKEIHKLCVLGVCKSELLRQEEENEWGYTVDASGQSKTTVFLEDQFHWWFDVWSKWRSNDEIKTIE